MIIMEEAEWHVRDTLQGRKSVYFEVLIAEMYDECLIEKFLEKASS